MIDLGLLTSVASFARDYYEQSKQREAALRAALRLLQLEVRTNLAVLDCLLLPGHPQAPTSNAPEYLAAVSALGVQAHESAFITSGLEDDEGDALQLAAQDRERIVALKSMKMEVELDDQLATFAATEVDGDLSAALQRLRRRKHVGLLSGALEVASRVRALQAVSALDEAALEVLKDLRIGLRLRTVQAYERAIAKRLEAHPLLRVETEESQP